MLKHKLVDFIIQFMEEVDKEISEMKLFVLSPFLSSIPSVLIYNSAQRESTIRCRTIPNAGMYIACQIYMSTNVL